MTVQATVVISYGGISMKMTNCEKPLLKAIINCFPRPKWKGSMTPTDRLFQEKLALIELDTVHFTI